jgi:acetyl/propionyl-CoA carboxylase alpha subunit
MTDDYEALIGERSIGPAEGWAFEWIDQAAGVARLAGAEGSLLVALEGGGTDWTVIIRGRRVAVTVRSWRERVMAEVAQSTATHAGPIDVAATLPGMIVAVAVASGDEVSEGDRLLTIEAMKMQNEVRAPRSGRIAAVAVEAGQTVATGTLLVRIEDHP